MPKIRTNNKRIAIILVIAFAVIIGGAAATAMLTEVNPFGWIIGTNVQPSEEPEQPQEPQTPTEVPEQPQEPVTFNFPETMRAVYLKPGADFLTKKDEAAADIQKEIDTALDAAVKLTMNTVIVPTSTEDYAIYNSVTRPTAVAVFDPLDYLIKGARERGLYIYCIFDLKAAYNGQKLVTVNDFGTNLLNSIEKELVGFVESYSPDGIFFDNYDYPETAGVYTHFLSSGAGMSFTDYQNSASRRIVSLASGLIREKAPGIQVGLLTGPQWATTKEDESGSATLAAYSMLTDGHSDIKAFLQDGLVDMIGVEAYGSLTDGKIPFQKVVSWWAKLAAENNVRMYAVQATDRMTDSSYTGWGSSDQLTKQLITVENIEGFNGSIFNDLATLVKDPAGATTLLLKYYRKEVNTQYIMTELSISKPTSLTYSTFEPTVIFRGASDPTNEVTMNGQKVTTDDNGYFSVSADLKAGLNTFTFKHKDKTITYSITRNVKIIQSVSPSGSMTVDGNTEVTLVAYAYANAKVTATIGGRTVTLGLDNSEDDNTDKDSYYVKYSGTYTTPAATGSVQNLGSITFTATWESNKETAAGAAIKVNKIVAVGSGSPIVISAAQAETFPTSTLDDLSDGAYYPLPKGTLDYTVGDQIVYSSGSTTYRYYKLSSGLRVYANDISPASEKVADVVIKGMSITANGSDTTVSLPMSQPTSYSVSYSSSGISFHFNYIKSTPGNLTSLTKNPLFSSATWSGNTLTLSFRTSNGMCGYTASYSGGTLSLRFNNVPASVSGARIVIDPGHGGTDVGALGFYPAKNEDYVNRQIAVELASILRSRGANVLLIDTSGSAKVTIQNRVIQATAFNPQLYLSVHCNSATSATAIGNEAYYFYSFSAPFARYVNSALYSAMGNRDRGTKYGLYYVTRTSQFTSVLAECGFMSNQSEYMQLLSNSSALASSLSNAVANYFSSIYSGYTATGTEAVGQVDKVAVTGVSLDKTTLTLSAGETATLTATVAPEKATEKSVSWSTSNAGAVTVAADGKLTAVAPGTATITVKTKDGEFTASCTVTVKAIEVSEVTLDKDTLGLKVGESAYLKATVKPDNATSKTVTWSSSNSSIVSVSEGNISGKAVGTVTITAACGKFSASCVVTVSAAELPATGVTLNETTLTLKVGDTATLTASPAPASTTDATTWSSSDDTIVSVSGGTLTALKAGSATITVRCGTASATCTVTVPEEAAASGTDTDTPVSKTDATATNTTATDTTATDTST